MQIRIVAVGRVREAFLRSGIEEYRKRLGPFAKVEIVEVREEPIRDGDPAAERERVLRREGEAILKALAPGHVIVTDIAGEMFSSEELARYIERLRVGGDSSVTFVIGGSLGVSCEVRERADLLLSFGPVTLPHQLFRLVLIEQIYRAFTILNGLPYHK